VNRGSGKGSHAAVTAANRNTEATGGTNPVAPRWLVIASFVLTLAGLALSIYLTISHYTDQAALFCQQNSVVNCLKVTTSPESEIFGIPVAVLGLVFFVPMTVLNLAVGLAFAAAVGALAAVGRCGGRPGFRGLSSSPPSWS